MAESVLVLGGTGMLGIAVVDELTSTGVRVLATTRDLTYVSPSSRAEFLRFDATVDRVAPLLERLGPGDVIINCVGVIKHHLNDRNPVHRRNAISINSDLPYAIAEAAQARGVRVIQIATDCVYAGTVGSYDEHSPHDAADVYGQTKSLGEVPASNFVNLRCSIIGRERTTQTSLLEWVLSHDSGDNFSGYVDHWWNGITTRAFGRIAAGLIRSSEPLTGTFHVVPADRLSKCDLSTVILAAFDAEGVTVDPVTTGAGLDRTLSTVYPQVNERLWRDAGYRSIPSIAELVDDIPRSDSHLRDEARV